MPFKPLVNIPQIIHLQSDSLPNNIAYCGYRGGVYTMYPKIATCPECLAAYRRKPRKEKA